MSAELGVQLELTACEAAWSAAAGPNRTATSTSAGVSGVWSLWSARSCGARGREMTNGGAKVVTEGTASTRAGALYAAQVRASSAPAEESTGSGTFSSETGSLVTTGGTGDSVGGASSQGAPSTLVSESLFSM